MAASKKSKAKSEKDTSAITAPLDKDHEGAGSVGTLEFVPVPSVLTDEDGKPLPHWRIQLNIDADPPAFVGFDLYGPLTMGRDPGEAEAGIDFLDLTPFAAVKRGVSRQHMELRPSQNGLFAVDLESTNGTKKNSVPIKPNSPAPIGNRDTLSLGDLHVTISIIDAPHQEADWLAQQATIGQALMEMAKTIATQLKVDDVLNTVVDYAVGLTNAQEATLWLLEPSMRELRLQAARGVESEFVGQVTLPLVGSIAGEVMLTGKPQVRTRDDFGKKVIITQDYMVDSVIFVPLALGGLSLGVLSVSNRTPGHDFTENDKVLLSTLADFAAIALQNSRTLEATDEALRESLHAQRDATTRALETTRLKSEFLSTMSHELRSPLHTINGFSRMILSETFGELPPGLQDAAERILKSGQNLLELVDDLLDSARIEAKELELVNEEIAPRELISEVVGGQMPVAKEKGLVLSWTSDPDVPDLLMGDTGRIRQVLTNLVANAIKFTDKGGVSVQIRMVGTLMWSVSVADTGRGIPPDQQDVIFERFRQLDQSTTREHGGVGLGLAISSDLVKMMGGALRVTSEGVPGKGSIFTMTLPVVMPGMQLEVVGDDDTIRLSPGDPSTRRIAAKPAPSSEGDPEG